MLVLGIESSCDETGVALCDSTRGLLGHRLHTQADMHNAYGGVVPELASRDHVRRILPLLDELLRQCDVDLVDLQAIAYTAGPGLAGALLVGASVGASLAFCLGIPALPVHHLEGHLLSPRLGDPAPGFPYLALLVSGGHTQLVAVRGVGAYEILGESMDDAAGEAFDKTAKLLGLGYPGGAALAKLAERGVADSYKLPRPKLHSTDLDFSFSGLKTAVAILVRDHPQAQPADVAASFEAAVVDVLCEKSFAALAVGQLERLVVCGGVAANRRLREELARRAEEARVTVYFAPLEFCSDNGAMIAYAAASRLALGAAPPAGYGFGIKPRWDLPASP